MTQLKLWQCGWMLLQLLDDKLLTLLLMPVQVDVIIGRCQIHRVTGNTAIQRLKPLNIHSWLLTLHSSVLPATIRKCQLFISVTCHINMSCLCYEHDVCPSVTLVDCDHIMQRKVEVATWHDRGVLTTCMPKPTRIVLSWIILKS